MSIAIATLGMFIPHAGGTGMDSGGGLIRVLDEKPKPIVRVMSVKSEDEGSKKQKIEITSISSGD